MNVYRITRFAGGINTPADNKTVYVVAPTVSAAVSLYLSEYGPEEDGSIGRVEKVNDQDEVILRAPEEED